MTPSPKSVLGDFCTIIDCEHKTAPTQEEGIPLIRTPNIGKGHFLLDNVKRVSDQTYTEWARRAEPKPGDLIMAREAPVGNVALITSGLKVCLGQRTVLVRMKTNKVDARYLNCLLNSPSMNGYMLTLSNGATVGHLNVNDIRKLELPPLPDITAQQKIAAILSAYDDLIENNQRRIALLEKMAEEIYREWFVRLRFPGYQQVKFVKGVPEGWRIVSIDAISVEVRKSVKKKDLSSSCRYIGLEHIPRKSFALNDYFFADSVDSNKLSFKAGDILFSKIRPYLHKVVLANFDGVCSTDAIVIRKRDVDCTGFLLLTVFSETFIELATTASKGTKMPRADWDFLRQLKILFPSEQLLIRFERLFADIFSEIEALLKTNELLGRTRNELLPRLISGKLSVEHLDIQFPPSMQDCAS
jgi:type I restriction enzyme S subunit